jgi:hypothetical protein
MNSSKAILWFGFAAALGMIGWGLSGVFTGRVMTKSYGTVDGERTYYRFVRRDEEPVWFWTLCSIYTGVGIGMLVVLFMVMPRVQ